MKLPENAVFVIANSLAEANKAASNHYNVRVAECRTATWILAKMSGLQNFCEIDTPKSLQQHVGLNLKEMSGLVEKYLHEKPYTVVEVIKLLFILLKNPKNRFRFSHFTSKNMKASTEPCQDMCELNFL